MRFTIGLLLVIAAACGSRHAAPDASAADAAPDAAVSDAARVLPPYTRISITLGDETQNAYFTQTSGGDTDTDVVQVGSPPLAAVRSGNGATLGTGNTIPDHYIQLDVADTALFQGQPTPSVLLEVQYFDEGTDGFVVEYDAAGGLFTRTHPVYKTNSLRFKTASFVLKDAYFGDRDNGADLRIDDLADGPVTVREVALTVLPVPTVRNVDQCGANPFDDLPDSTAIQSCIDQMADGDTLELTSGGGRTDYRGYLIDKTLFAVTWPQGRRFLTFTSTDPTDPALLQATAQLQGFVLQLMARSKVTNVGAIDHITFDALHVDSDRAERRCVGPDGMGDGVDDNWGSWLANECGGTDDPWCNAGGINLSGAYNSYAQDWEAHPGLWSEDIVASRLVVTNTECGTAFGMSGAANTIVGCTIDTAGDHVHASGCTSPDPDGDGLGDWSDGMTLIGPGHLILDNVVHDGSDVGIVFFGGRETVIRGDTVTATPGNHGMFAGIAIHPWALGDVSGTEVVGNTVVNQADATCGGIHAGIDLGTHMWGGGCGGSSPLAVGTAGCVDEPAAPQGALCPAGSCQMWAYVPSGAVLLLRDNNVTGAGINYLVEGVDGTIDESNNQSTGPRATDWGAATAGCNGVTWGPTDKIAHHPSLAGWTDTRIHCER